MKIGVGRGNWQCIAFVQAHAAQAVPIASAFLADQFGYRLWKRPAPDSFVGNSRIMCILQDFADVGERLMQRPSARRSGLDHSARAAFAGDQPFILQPPKRLANGEARHTIALAKLAFGWKLVARGKLSREQLGAQFRRHLQIAWGVTLARDVYPGVQSWLPSGGRMR